MLVYSVVSTLRGSRDSLVELTTELNSRANEVMDTDVSLFASVAGYPAGTFVFSTVVESFAQAMSQNEKLYSDSQFKALQEKSQEFWVAPAETKIRQVLAMAPENPPEISVGAVVGTFWAEAKGERLVEVMEFGTEITPYVANGSAAPLAFARNIVGNVGEFMWMALYTDAAALDKALAWEATDVGYAERYAAGAPLFVNGSGRRGLVVRIA